MTTSTPLDGGSPLGKIAKILAAALLGISCVILGIDTIDAAVELIL